MKNRYSRCQKQKPAICIFDMNVVNSFNAGVFNPSSVMIIGLVGPSELRALPLGVAVKCSQVTSINTIVFSQKGVVLGL